MMTTLCMSNASPSPSHVVIVGASGKVGRAFSSLLPTATLVTRNANLTETLQNSPLDTPILVCTTNDALSHVISETPASRRPDLIFLQNGILLSELTRWDLQDCTTQVLLYLAATPSSDDIHRNTPPFTDGKQTVCIGKWANWFSTDVLLKNNLQCRVVSDFEEYKVLVMHKLLWACIFWMMSAALGGISVGEIVEKHRKDVEELVDELVAVANRSTLFTTEEMSSCRGFTGNLDSRVAVEAVIAYSMSIPAASPSKEMALKEFNWRNGWFLGQRPERQSDGLDFIVAERRSFEDGRGWKDQTLHIEWLRRAGAGHYIV